MKKISCLSLVLCIALVVQLLSFPAFATETETTQQTEATKALEDTVVVPSAAFGTASVLNGCRTMDAQIPLGGSDRILESAQAAFVYEQNTGTVLYSYYPDTTLNPGPLVKLMNAIVALENGNLADPVTVSTANYSTLPAGAIDAELKNDEVMSLEDMLNCMVLELANDAAISIAEHIAGSESAFVEKMNATAQAIGCTGTVFSNCHGVSSTGQATTARDMARIMEYAMKNAYFRKLVAAESYTVPATNRSEKRELKSLNYLKEQTIMPKYNDERVTGGVATYGTSSGASLVCTAENKAGLSLIIVVLGCERTFTDSGSVSIYGNYEEVWDLLAFGFDNYKVCRLIHDGQSMSQFTVANGENDVVGQTLTAMDAVLPISAKLENLILKYNVTNGGLTAPVEAGEMISTLQVWYRNSCIAETEIYAMSPVRSLEDSELEIQGSSRDDSNLSDILSFLGVVLLIILVPATIYLIVNHIRRTIARNRRRRRRRARRRSR